MRTRREFEAARRLIEQGLGASAIARATGIPRGTIRYWQQGSPQRFLRGTCPRCDGRDANRVDYAYLLGLYLGDGHLSRLRRGVYRLRISLDARYPGIVAECARAMANVAAPRRVHQQRAPGCIVVGAYWSHWPCLFPQHGPGPKHLRPIILAPWQLEIVTALPGPLLRGLIHSDGSRVPNRVNGRVYVRYHFSNRSPGIREIFRQACLDHGVHVTASSWKELSVARRADVARLDQFVGPKL